MRVAHASGGAAEPDVLQPRVSAGCAEKIVDGDEHEPGVTTVPAVTGPLRLEHIPGEYDSLDSR